MRATGTNWGLYAEDQFKPHAEPDDHARGARRARGDQLRRATRPSTRSAEFQEYLARLPSARDFTGPELELAGRASSPPTRTCATSRSQLTGIICTAGPSRPPGACTETTVRQHRRERVDRDRAAASASGRREHRSDEHQLLAAPLRRPGRPGATARPRSRPRLRPALQPHPVARPAAGARTARSPPSTYRVNLADAEAIPQAKRRQPGRQHLARVDREPEDAYKDEFALTRRARAVDRDEAARELHQPQVPRPDPGHQHQPRDRRLRPLRPAVAAVGAVDHRPVPGVGDDARRSVHARGVHGHRSRDRRRPARRLHRRDELSSTGAPAANPGDDGIGRPSRPAGRTASSTSTCRTRSGATST